MDGRENRPSGNATAARILDLPGTGHDFTRRAVTCLVTIGVHQSGLRDIKEIMAACRDSTNLVNLVASCRKRVVPIGCLVICDPIQPHTREEVVRLYVGVDRKTAQS
jgi:hypothetical protein